MMMHAETDLPTSLRLARDPHFAADGGSRAGRPVLWEFELRASSSTSWCRPAASTLLRPLRQRMEASPLRLSRCLPVVFWLFVLTQQSPPCSAAPSVSSDSKTTLGSESQPSDHRRERPSQQIATSAALTGRTLSQAKGSGKGGKMAFTGAADAVRQQGGGLGKSRLDPQGPRDEVRSGMVSGIRSRAPQVGLAARHAVRAERHAPWSDVTGHHRGSSHAASLHCTTEANGTRQAFRWRVRICTAVSNEQLHVHVLGISCVGQEAATQPRPRGGTRPDEGP